MLIDKEIIEKAKKEADKAKRDSIFELKEESHKLKLETDKEIKERKLEIKDLEDRLLQREKSIDKRDEILQNRDKMLEERDNALILKQKEIQKAEEEMEELKKKEMEILESISGFSKEKAKDMIMKRVEDDLEVEITSLIKEREAEAKLEVDRKAKDMLVMCVGFMQRHNFWMRAAIIGHCNRRIKKLINKYDYCILLSNTDSIVSTERIPEIEDQIGTELGQWKIEHEGDFAYIGHTYQWNMEKPKWRGIPKTAIPEKFDLLTDYKEKFEFVNPYYYDIKAKKIIKR